ncbi:MAG TPA: FAD-binding protein, partial [Thermoanaerobaculia bacterium]|nr:FAD-binding protein [Thermoanaerobaculia bacterium]
MTAAPPPLDPAALGLVRPDTRGLARLRDLLGPDSLRTDLDGREAHGRDETERLCFLPDAVVLPRSTEEVSRLLALAHAERWPVVPRGAGTGLSGGALPVAGGIVLSLARLDRIRDLDLANLTVTAEAGVVLADLQRRVDEHGLRYPPDPASRESCRLGGNLAEDSAGPRSCKYGTTRDWV